MLISNKLHSFRNFYLQKYKATTCRKTHITNKIKAQKQIDKQARNIYSFTFSL